ncbi:hypothetical protein SPHS6_02787 [Sphingobium sp. S6]|nr:hypothetical protein SPHS6_02787 [Sphingobium sp. S6]CAD7340335.1 hypothetical protein SPHS8_03046 [Sphingobium sp. S8]
MAAGKSNKEINNCENFTRRRGRGGAPGEGRADLDDERHGPCSDASYSLFGRSIKRPMMFHCASQYVGMYQHVSAPWRWADFSCLKP